MLFAFFDEEGRLKEGHNDDTKTELPEGAFALSLDQWDRRFDLLLRDGVLTIDPPVVPSAQVKNLVWNKIKAERDRLTQSGGYKVGLKWYHSDIFSRTQQMGLVMLGANIPPNTLWKTMDGTTVTMTQSLAGQIFAAAAASDIAIFAVAEAHRTAMEASADPAAYDFSVGWPKVFGE